MSDPRTIILVALDNDGPVITWTGDSVTADELIDAAQAVRYVAAQVSGGATDSAAIVSGAREAWRVGRQAAETERQRQEAVLAAHPWQCEFCPDRFKTRRGAEQHERGCVRNPNRRVVRRRARTRL